LIKVLRFIKSRGKVCVFGKKLVDLCMTNSIKNELQTIIRGDVRQGSQTLIHTVLSNLNRGKSTSTKLEKSEFGKREEEEILIPLINKLGIWNNLCNSENYLSEGAEQKVHLDRDGRHVLKINTGVFYVNWSDYFHSLLLHNYFFPATAYELLGFVEDEEQLCAVVKQPYVKATETTDLELVKEFLISNGFENQRYNDYKNTNLGIILEDLHDENVLSKEGVLFFIDTVFYLMPSFYAQ
jgi:hypothetical protein